MMYVSESINPLPVSTEQDYFVQTYKQIKPTYFKRQNTTGQLNRKIKTERVELLRFTLCQAGEAAGCFSLWLWPL